jgi:SAM-dependent methyltransferase
MDAGTRAFYERYAASFAAQDEAAHSAMSRRFAVAGVVGARVLDVGCGSGRDVAVLQAMGADAYGVEPNAAMRACALERHPRLAGRIADAALPALGQPFGGEFDVVACSAVLMHLTAAQLPTALQALVDVLAPGGRLLIAVPALDEGQLSDGRDRDDRLFTSHDPQTLVALLAERGVELVERWEMTVGAPPAETLWTTLLTRRKT